MKKRFAIIVIAVSAVVLAGAIELLHDELDRFVSELDHVRFIEIPIKLFAFNAERFNESGQLDKLDLIVIRFINFFEYFKDLFVGNLTEAKFFEHFLEFVTIN